MNKKLTLKTSLQHCLKVWRELAATGSASKPDYCIQQYKFSCPCCDYVSKRSDGYVKSEAGYFLKCSLCPLKTLFTKDFKGERYIHVKQFYPCEYNTNSPYHLWKREDKLISRQGHAKKIADECERLLNKMKKAKKKQRQKQKKVG